MFYSLRESENIRDKKALEFYDQGFHGDNYLIMLANKILRTCVCFIETGTNVGSTLAHVARSFKDVQCFSCEPDPIAFEQATKNTNSYTNVQIYNETSQDFLARLQKEMKHIFHENVLFWLDAHGYGFKWPLRDEVRFIAENFKHAYILIDDFKVPGLGCFGFDEYGTDVCSFEYIKDCFSQKNFDLYYPTYTERTSKFHALRGWGLIVLGQNFRIPECLKDKMAQSKEHMKKTNDDELIIGIEEKKDSVGAKLNYLFTDNWWDRHGPYWHKFLVPWAQRKGAINILEIGSYEGRSACRFLNNLAKKSQTSLVCVDNWERNDEKKDWDTDREAVFRRFQRNLYATGKFNQVKILKGDSRQVLKNLSDQVFDLIYVAGDHAEEVVCRDTISSYNLLADGGILLWEDYFDSDEVKRGVDSACDELGIIPDKLGFNVYYMKNISNKDSVDKIIRQTPQAFSEAANQNDIEQYKKNPENTYLISFPRTGSHWLRMMLELYFDRPTLTRIFYKHRNSEYLLLHHHDVDCDVVRTHVIYLYRDPVDTIFSQMNYYKENESDLRRIKYWSERYGRHLQKWLVDETFTRKKLILSYEDLRNESLAGFERISKYYNTSFDRIRAQEAITQISKSNVRAKTALHDPQVLNVSPNYEHRRQVFHNHYAEFIWRTVLKGRDEVGIFLRGERPVNQSIFSGAPATMGKKLSSKIVGLVPGHNEESRIAGCLRALARYTDAIVFLDDCSDDNTLKIVQELSEECYIEKIISKDEWYRDEPGDRNLLLQAGREIGGTHFIVLDADEMFTANCAEDNLLRQNIMELKPGDYLSMVWIQLWRSVSQYRFDNSIWTNNYKNFAFCDDGKCFYESEFIHTSRLPSNLKGKQKILDGYNYGVLHFQFVNWRNLLVKQAWYRCLERIRQPGKPVEEINKRYAPSKDETALCLTEAPFKWFSGYNFFNEEAYHVPDKWRETQVLEWFEKYGIAHFSDLDIWDIDWDLKGNPEAEKHAKALALQIDGKNPVNYEQMDELKKKSRGIGSPRTDDMKLVEKYCSEDTTARGNYLVSAIVSAYKSERFIRGCLDDLEAQTIADKLEIIVIDSGSPQNESAVVRDFQQRYHNIKYIRTEERESIYAAWNRGIKEARGKFITNANTDDRHREDAFEVMAEALNDYPEVALVYADQIITKKENETFEKCTVEAYFKWPEFNREQLLCVPCVGPQPMWRKDLHDELGYFDESLVVAGDYEWWLRISERYPLKHLSKVLGLYLLGRGVEHSNPKITLDETTAIRQLYIEKTGYSPDSSKYPKNFIVTKYNVSLKTLPMVSVIVPTYNRPEMLAEALKSINNQTYQDFEIVVVNDGGVEVENIIERLNKNNNIKYIRYDVNKDRAAARNTGIRAAKGKYIAYLDDDDIFYPNHLETLVNYLENSDYKVAYTNSYRAHQILDGDTYKIVDKDLPFSNEFSRDLLLIKNISPVNCFMHEKTCLDEVGLFDEDFKTHEDWDLWIKMSRKYEFKHIRKVTCEFRERTDGSSTTSSESQDFLRTMNIIYKRYYEYCKNNPIVLTEQVKNLQQLKDREINKKIKRKCAIIIPVFNNLDYTKQCLEALFKNTPEGLCEVIIVDNGSKDGTKEYLKSLEDKIVVRTNRENIGFAKACNQGAAAASGEYLLFLNNDTQVKPGWIAPLINILEKDSRVAAAGSKLLYPDGTIQHAGVIIVDDKRLPEPLGALHVHRTRFSSYPDANRSRIYQSLTAACLLVRKSAFLGVKGFDENYSNGFEDVDLCFKLQKNGWLLVYEPMSVVIHYESKSGPERFKHHHENLKILNQKWQRKISADLLIEENGKETLTDSGHIKPYMLPDSSKTRKTVSIIIPVYNKVEFTKQCIEALTKNVPENLIDLVIIDNGSTDGTGEFLKNLNGNITIITNKENRGFARACNQGERAASGDYLLFLNNDIIVNNDWLKPLVNILDDDPNIAAVGSKLLFPDGKIQHAGVIVIDDRKLPDPLVGRHIYYKQDPDFFEANQMRTYQALTAACLLVRKSSFHEVGGFDEGYWNGYEDVDLCFKFQEHGWSLVYEPRSVAIHYESQSGPERFKQVSGNIERLHQKWLGKITPDIVIETDGSIKSTEAAKIAPYISPKQRFKHSKDVFSDLSPLTSIIILTHNQLEYTKKCIESLYKHTENAFELIVVDNASTDGTIRYLETELRNHRPDARIKIIKNKENLGFAAGNNRGLAQAEGEYIVLMNNDVVVTPGWLRKMISCAESFPEAGIVGPMTNYAPGPQFIKDVAYDRNTLSGLNRFSDGFAESHRNKAKRVLRVVGFCMLIKRAVIDKIGGMDDLYGLGNFEDDDFSLRATLCGFQSWIVQDCFVHHFGSRTFKGAGIDYNESLHRNWELFKEKWDMPKDLPYGSYNLSQIGRQTFDPDKDYISVEDKSNSAAKEKEVENFTRKDEIGRNAENEFKEMGNKVEASVIIPISNQQKYIKKCIESIKRHTNEPHEIILIDNGVSKGTLKRLRPIINEKSNYNFVEVDKNLGLAKWYNEAIRASNGEYLFFLHNDVVVSEDWLSGMLKCLKSGSDIGIVGPMTNDTGGVQKDVGADYPSIDYFDAYAKAFRKRNRHRKVPIKNVTGYCFACKKDFIEEIGFFDEDFDSEKVMVEDLCLRASLKGYKGFIASDVFIHHYCSHKESKGKESGAIASDRRILLEKIRNIASKGPFVKKFFSLSATEKADELWQKDNIKAAVNELTEAIKKLPNEKGMYFDIAHMLIDTKQFEDALSVLHMMPKDGLEIRKLELVGYCKEGMGLYNEAEEYVEQLLTINPNSALGLNLKGILAYRKGDERAAEEFFNRAIDSDRSYGEPYANLGFMRWTSGKEKEALEYFEKGFILTPTVTDIFANYHAVIKSLGEFNRAEIVFRDACALYPHNKRLRYLFIDILIQLKKYAEAMNEIEETMVDFDIDDGIFSAALEVRNSLGAMEIEMTSKKNPTVSLCMIAKDEEQHLGKCLMHMKPIVDEIIVVDTGSNDRTKDIASVFGAKVYDFEWTNDFSEARNYSISKACGDWIFVLDADEIISSVDYEAFRKIVKKRTSMPVGYSFATRNYSMRSDIIGLNSNDRMYCDEEAGVGWVPSDKVRLFPNNMGIRFEYPVHEIVEPFLRRKGAKIKKCEIPIHHYGQLNKDTRACKGEKYYQIGRAKLDEMGDNVTAIYELAVQAGMLEKWEEAIELWERLIHLRPNLAVAHVNMGTAYQNIGKYESAANSAKKAMGLAPGMKEAFHDYALYQLFLGNAKEAIIVLEDTMNKFPEYLSAHFKLGIAYFCDNRKDEGMEVLKKLGCTEVGAGLAVSCHTIAEKFFSLKMINYAEAVLEAAIESGNVNEEVVSLFNDCHAETGGKFIVPEGVPAVHEAVISA